MRLRTLPLALSSIAMGTFLAAAAGKFNLVIFLLCILTTILLQVLSNLANDYGDSIHGADHEERLGPERTVQSGQISPGNMRMAIGLSALLSLLSGIALLVYSLDVMAGGFFVFLGLGLAAILAALGYTLGKKPYGYQGLGDLFVLIFFGLIGVSGTYFLFTGTFNFFVLLPALSSGFMATAVLNINNIRDIDSDIKAGKKSIPVRLGRDRAVIYHWFLLGGALLSASFYIVVIHHNPWQFAFLITLPLFIMNGMSIKRADNPVEIDPYLKKMALTSLIFTMIFGICLLI